MPGLFPAKLLFVVIVSNSWTFSQNSIQPHTGNSLAFEVVSVKSHPRSSGTGRGRGGRGEGTKIVSDPGRLTMTNVNVGSMVEYAFDLSSAGQIVNIPDWFYKLSFDVVGVSATAASRTQQKLMLQSFLAERFHLSCHLDNKPGPVYELTVAKSSRLEPAKEPGGNEVSRFSPRLVVHDDGSFETIYSATSASVSDLAKWLSSLLTKPVVDKTAIAGEFDIKLSVIGTQTPATEGKPGSTFTEDRDYINAVRSQLGLKLEAARGPVQTLVIDRVSLPTDN